MNKNLNSDKQMREKLAGFSVQPPSHIWNNVQGKLAAQQKRKRMIYFNWISAAAVVLLAFLAGWYFNNSSEIITPLAVEQQTIQPENREKNIVQKEKDLNAELTEKQQMQNKNIQTKDIGKNSQKTDNTLIAATIKSEENKEIISAPQNYERVEMKTIKRMDVKFEPRQNEMLLAEKSVQQKEYILTETDKFLMAVNASSAKSKSKSETGWKIGVGVTPGYSSHVVNHSETYSQNMTYPNESGNGNIGGGFSIQYKTSKKLRIESGVYYAQNGQTSDNSVKLFANREMADFAAPVYEKSMFCNSVSVSNGNMSMNSTAGVIVMSETPKGAEINSELDAFNPQLSNSLVSDGEFSQVFEFIEIPLYLRYRILDTKFGIELLGGVNAGVVIGNNAYIDNSYGLQNIGETEDISTVNLSGTVGIGMNYALGKHISVAVEPRLNYYFTSINSSPEVDFRPYRIGIFTGLYYEF
jgi:hypothetical protein